MIRDLEGEKLDGWLEDAEASEAEVMRKFAVELKKDLKAVRAGLILRAMWSRQPHSSCTSPKLPVFRRIF